VDEILSIRRELDGPLIRFRVAVARFSDGMRAAGWDPEFVEDAEEVFVREVEPAVQEIEDAVRDSSFVAQLLPSMTASQNWVAGGALGMAAYNLASLPELASLAVGGGVGFASGVRAVRRIWSGERAEEMSKRKSSSSTTKPVGALVPRDCFRRARRRPNELCPRRRVLLAQVRV